MQVKSKYEMKRYESFKYRVSVLTGNIYYSNNQFHE